MPFVILSKLLIAFLGKGRIKYVCNLNPSSPTNTCGAGVFVPGNGFVGKIVLLSTKSR